MFLQDRRGKAAKNAALPLNSPAGGSGLHQTVGTQIGQQRIELRYHIRFTGCVGNSGNRSNAASGTGRTGWASWTSRTGCSRRAHRTGRTSCAGGARCPRCSRRTGRTRYAHRSHRTHWPCRTGKSHRPYWSHRADGTRQASGTSRARYAADVPRIAAGMMAPALSAGTAAALFLLLAGIVMIVSHRDNFLPVSQ